MIERLPLSAQVPAAADRLKVERVLNLILRHVGPGNPVRGATIAEQLELTGRDPERQVQAVVKFLVEERHVPIGTLPYKPYGYFILSSNDDRRLVRGHFVRRALSNLEHARAYDTDSIVAPLVGQIELTFPEAKR